MKAEVKYTYDEQEMQNMILANHSANYPAPQGMEWIARIDNYPYKVIVSAQSIKKEAVPLEEGDGQDPVVLEKPEVLV